MHKAKILLVGCGAMGGALKKGWEQGKASFDVTVIDPSTSSYFPDLDSLPSPYQPEAIVFAVKPQIFASVLPPYARFSARGCLFTSVVTGFPLKGYHEILGPNEKVIRVMPNLPVTVGEGMSVLITQSLLTQAHRTLGESLFSSSGKVLWLEDESLMETVTAVSGSGPAYFFRMVECLAEAGTAGGLNPDFSMQLARQTAIGAGRMMRQLPDSAEDLRKRVTSPGGTTAAALSVFDQRDALSKIMTKAVEAATQRGRELSQ